MKNEFCEDCADKNICNGDCPYFEEEQRELEEKAKKIKIDHGAKAEKSEKKEKKPKTVKVSDEKVKIFQDIVAFLQKNYNISVEKDNKLIKISENGKEFKLDLIESRQKK